MPTRTVDKNVLDAAIDRYREMFSAGHRIVISFSGGKDSGVCLELASMVGEEFGALPIDVVMRDEEIMLPGTFEYCERVASRTKEFNFHWLIANQPIINIFNREQPYFWTFDPLLPPEQWVRIPPKIAEYIPDKNINRISTRAKFPPKDPEAQTISVLGLRAGESLNRKMGLLSSKGYLTRNRDSASGTLLARPVYDWQDGDVWKAINNFGWDYNHAYDTMARMGLPKRKLRIAPPTLTAAGVEVLVAGAKAYPNWFDKVCKRLPGIRAAGLFGRDAIKPVRRINESWSECYQRTCITHAPAWIAERAIKVRDNAIREWVVAHTDPFPEVGSKGSYAGCTYNSWKKLCHIMFMGDPFSMKQKFLPYIEPEFFRPGSGTWGGKPTW